MNPLLHGFPALLGKRSRLLILGSMPGVASLVAAQYYAHPRNQFWLLMQRLCAVDPRAEYPHRCQALQAAGIALWDVYRQCRRAGSLDSAIERDSAQINPLAPLLQARPELACIACNGSAAGQAFRRHVLRRVGQRRDEGDDGDGSERWLLDLDTSEPRELQVLVLPSSSPAHAALDLEQKWQRWRVLQRWVDLPGRSKG